MRPSWSAPTNDNLTDPGDSISSSDLSRPLWGQLCELCVQVYSCSPLDQRLSRVPATRRLASGLSVLAAQFLVVREAAPLEPVYLSVSIVVPVETGLAVEEER